MKVVENPKLKEAFSKLDNLWENQRMVGVHKEDVENILIEIFEDALFTPYLQPCPFCGREPRLIERNSGQLMGDSKYDVGCYKEGCYLEFGADWWFEKEDAIQKWNNRV